MNETEAHGVDMSPGAVFRRLQEASDLLQLCLTLGTASRVQPGPAPTLDAEDSSPQREH